MAPKRVTSQKHTSATRTHIPSKEEAGCRDFTIPQTRRAWLTAKIEGNRRRDAANEQLCRSLGWHVVTIWACATKTRDARAWLAARLPSLIGPLHRAPRTRYPAGTDAPPALRAAESPDRSERLILAQIHRRHHPAHVPPLVR